MTNKYLLAVLGIVACTSVQSAGQYPELTNNYDSVLQADLNELRSHYQYEKSDPLARYSRGEKLIYVTKETTPIRLDNINKPVHSRFVKADQYFSEELIYKTIIKKEVEVAVYVLKDRLAEIKSQNHMLCEYKAKLNSYGDDDGYYYNSLKGLKNSYLNFTSGNGYNIKSFIDEKNLQGFIKDKNGYDSGSIRVLIKGRILTLSIFDCPQVKSKEQIIKDLTEWGELLIKVN